MKRSYQLTPEGSERKAAASRRTLARLWQMPTFREKMVKIGRRMGRKNGRNPACIAARTKGFKAMLADPERRAAYIAVRTKWRHADDYYLIERYGKQSAREIAAALGVTRNAVIGRAHRLGLSA